MIAITCHLLVRAALRRLAVALVRIAARIGRATDTDMTVVTRSAGVRHYKGGLYAVIARARHADTREDLVVYASVESGQVFVRSARAFTEIVGPPAARVPRFITEPLATPYVRARDPRSEVTWRYRA